MPAFNLNSFYMRFKDLRFQTRDALAKLPLAPATKLNIDNALKLNDKLGETLRAKVVNAPSSQMPSQFRGSGR